MADGSRAADQGQPHPYPSINLINLTFIIQYSYMISLHGFAPLTKLK